MRFFQRVTFQAPTEVRTPSGGVTYTWENVPSLTDIPARITAVLEERRGERTVVLEDRFDILIAGDHDAVASELAVLDGESVYDVVTIQPPALGRRGRKSTRVIAQRVAI